jgi:hypothetical protein
LKATVSSPRVAEAAAKTYNYETIKRVIAKKKFKIKLDFDEGW